MGKCVYSHYSENISHNIPTITNRIILVPSGNQPWQLDPLKMEPGIGKSSIHGIFHCNVSVLDDILSTPKKMVVVRVVSWDVYWNTKGI